MISVSGNLATIMYASNKSPVFNKGDSSKMWRASALQGRPLSMPSANNTQINSFLQPSIGDAGEARHHLYGTTPNAPGAVNYVRDAAVASAAPYYRDVLRALQSPLPGHKLTYLIRLLPIIIVFLALCVAAASVVIGAQRAAGYGMTSVLVDEDKLTTNFTASLSSVWQQWAFRIGQPGPNSQATTPPQGTAVTFTLPNAGSAPEGAVVIVRNINFPYWKSADRSTGSTIQNAVKIVNIGADNDPITQSVPNVNNTAASSTNWDTVVQAKSWVAATSFDNVRRWYYAGLPVM
jgi:hypothetical protein